MNKKSLLILPVFVLILVSGVNAAVNPFSIKFPISELGNCVSMNECRVYCDQPANADACLSFAEKQGLVKKEEVDQAKKLKKSLSNGDVPVAGCTDETSCKKLCGLPENHDACFKWATEHGLINSQNQTQQNQAPQTKPESQSDQKHGINKEKALQAIKDNGGPGGCTSFEECGQFCSQPSNQKACFNYATKYGLMSNEEVKQAEKFVSHPGPGGCTGEACKTYCADQSHHEECLKFAVDNGFITKDQADQEEKHKNLDQNLQNFGGPGGCKDQDECRQYCSNPSNIQECNNFAEKSGLIRPGEAKRNIEQFQKFQNNNPTENGVPLENNLKNQTQQTRPDNNLPAFQNGPGKCSNPEECIKYCSDPQNRSECAQFGPKNQGSPPGGTFQQAPPPGSENLNNQNGNTDNKPYPNKLDYPRMSNVPYPSYFPSSEQQHPMMPQYSSQPSDYSQPAHPQYSTQPKPEYSYQPQPSYAPYPQQSTQPQYPPGYLQPTQYQPSNQTERQVMQQMQQIPSQPPPPGPSSQGNSFLKAFIRFLAL